MPEMVETSKPSFAAITPPPPIFDPAITYSPPRKTSPAPLLPSTNPSSPPPATAEPPPPPYTLASAPNPGFCLLAFSERHANRTPGGGMTASQYYAPCAACGAVIGDEITAGYKEGWRWIDPSVNFRWESHLPKTTRKGNQEMAEKGNGNEVDLETGEATRHGDGESLSCWICWEYEEKFVEPMGADDWYLHMKRHFKDDGFRICVGKTGGMQRRRNCGVSSCPKIHS